MKPNWTKEQFIRAVQNGRYAEYNITPTLCLLTDWKDGGFSHIVKTDMSEEYTAPEVEDLVAELDWLRCDGVEQEKDYVWYLINPEITE